MYKLCACFSGEFQFQIVCLSYDSIYTYIDRIREDFIKKNVPNAKIIIDQLLITGNKSNRFLSIDFEDFQFMFNSAINVTADQQYKQRTADVLMGNEHLLRNSVLSDQQKKLIINGCAI